MLGFPIPLTIFQLFMITFMFNKDTPKFLISQGKDEEAKKVLERIYDTTETDIDTIFEYVKSTISKVTSKVPLTQALCGNKYRKGTWIAAILIIFHELSGINVIFLYSNTIFT